MNATTDLQPPVPSSRRATLVWVATIFALSPAILDLVAHWWQQPWARYSAIFVPVLVWQLLRGPSVEPRPRHGAVWLACAVACMLFASAAGVPRLGRVAIPLAVLGACRVLGSAPSATALIGVWIVPAPHTLSSLTAGQLPAFWLGLAGPPMRWLIPGLETVRARASLDGAIWGLAATDGGLATLLWLAGLGWTEGVWRRESLRGCLQRAVLWSLVAWAPVQVLAMAGALAGFGLSGSGAARATLIDLPLLLGVGLWGWRNLRRQP